MKKVTAAVLGTTLLASSFLAGCGSDTANKDSGSSSKDGKTVVTVWAWDKNFNIPIMEEAAKRYEATHTDVDIKVVDYAKEDVEKKLTTGLQSQTLKSLPDITLMEDYGAQVYLKNYKGMFADLTDKVNKEDFASYKIKAFTLDDKLYGLPFDSGVSALFYRRDYFEKAGYKAADLENITWSQLLEMGKKVAAANPGVSLMADNKNDPTGLIRQAMQSAGMWYFDESGKVTMAENPAALEMLDDLKKVDEAGIWKSTNGWDEWVSAANKGETAVYTTGAWFIPSIMAAKDQSGKWGIAPFPRLDNTKSVNASNLGGSSWAVVDKKDKSTEIAIDFLMSTFGSDKDFYQQILKNEGAIGTYLPAQDGEAYQEASEFFGGQKIYQDFSKWMKEIPEVNYGSNTNTGDEMIKSAIPNFWKGASAQEVLKDAETQVKNQVKQ